MSETRGKSKYVLRQTEVAYHDDKGAFVRLVRGTELDEDAFKKVPESLKPFFVKRGAGDEK